MVFTLRTSTESKCHAAPIPVLSCPMMHRSMTPKFLHLTVNTSLSPRSKLFFELLSTSSPDDPRSPTISAETFASHPLNLMSLVLTVIL